MFEVSKYLFLSKVARTKSATQPMTSEELAIAGIPLEAEGTSVMTTDSAAEAFKATDTCEGGEIQSGEC
jgi:hypothetical protein